MLRIGVVAALVGGGLAVTAAPALAQAPTVTITRLSSNTLNAGQSATLQYQVTNNDGGIGNNRQIDIRVNISGNGLSCSGACGSRETITDQDNFNATLRASSNLPAGSSQTVTISVTATNNANETSQAATVQVTLRGPDAPQTVKSISGRVVNSANSKGISDATVALNDTGGHSYTTQTDSDGDFKFTSSNSNPISPGQVLIGAGKEGFQSNKTSTNVSAGQTKTGLRLTLRSTASPTASASAASPTAEESLAETVPEDQASAEESIDPAAAGNQGSDSGGGLFSWVLIVLGGLLVALGVGAIVLLVIRRKDGGEDDTGDPLPGPNGPRPTPGAQGVFRGGSDPTMVAGGAAMGGNPTMAMRPGLAEAPTMMHKPVDEYGDPYGTPLRAPQPTSGPPPGAPQPGYGYQGGYGPGGSPTAPMAPGSPGAPTAYGSASPNAYGSASPAGYGNGATNGYGGAAAGRASASAPDPYAPRDYAPPASQGGGYGYDEPTGRYDRDAGYGPQDQGGPRPPAGPAPGGYDADRGYGQPSNGYDGGYGGGNGYGRQDGGYAPGADNGYEPAPRGGGYDGGRYQESPPSGYGPQDGYDGYGQQQGGYPPYEQGGYDQQPGYDRAPEPRQGGSDQQQRGYDQGGYYDEPTTRGERPSRRSLDWLDD